MSWPPDYQMASDNWPGISKLAEECGELVQIIMKIIGTGGTMHFKDPDSPVVERSRLVEEMADVYAALRFVQSHCLTDDERLDFWIREADKLALFERWKREEA